MSSWFYAGPDSKPIGPLTLDELQRLRLLGTIAPETYVIEQTGSPGLAWRPYRDLFPDPFTLPPIPSVPPPPTPAPLQPAPSKVMYPLVPSNPLATPPGYVMPPARVQPPVPPQSQQTPQTQVVTQPPVPTTSFQPSFTPPFEEPKESESRTLPRGTGLPTAAVLSNPEPAEDPFFTSESQAPVYSAPSLATAIIPPETNNCALFGFLLSMTALLTVLVCGLGMLLAPFSLIVSILGMVQLRNRNPKFPQTGRGLAISGIAISCFVLVVGFILIVVVLPQMGGQEPSPIGPADDN